MPTISDNAICLRRWDFSETSQTVSLLTREHGIIRGIAKGAKREKGGFSGGIELLTRGHLVAIVKPGRDLATLTEWRLEELFPAARRNLEANRAALYMVDLVSHMMTEQDPHPAVFDALIHALRSLDSTDRIPAALLHLQWTVLKEAGYTPRLARDAQTGRPLPSDQPVLAFSPEAGGLVDDTGESDRWRVRRETVILLHTLSGGEMPETNNAAMRRANRLLGMYCRHLIGRELTTMRWLFSDPASGE